MLIAILTLFVKQKCSTLQNARDLSYLKANIFHLIYVHFVKKS